MNTNCNSSFFYSKSLRSLFVLLHLFVGFGIASNAASQSLEKIIPTGQWVEFKPVIHKNQPILVHLRTGYERAIVFPESVALFSINKNPVQDMRADTLQKSEWQPDTVMVYDQLPGCAIEVDNDFVGFSPLSQFENQTVVFTGESTGTRYTLVVSSSPNGSRQPIDIQR